MAKQLDEAPPAHRSDEVMVERPKRAKLTEEETLRRMESFDDRREQFVAAVRKSKS